MGTEARARLGLWFVLAVSLLSFNQVFESGDYPGPALLGGLIATAIVIGTRRLGLGSTTTTLASLAGLLLYLALIFKATQTLWGLPTPEAVAALGRALQRAWEQSRIDFAPVPIRPGYEIMIVSAFWMAATIGELASFRWRRPVLAVVVPISLTTVAVVVGTGTATSLIVLAFLASLLTYWGLESIHRLRSWGRWVSAWAHDRDPQPDQLGGALALRLGATCLTAALVSPLFLPALGDGLLSWRTGIGSGNGGGSGGGNSLDPWVSIKPRLVEQSEDELFRIRSADVAYWRVATLDEFNGVEWEEEESERVSVEATGAIEGPRRPPVTNSERLRQTIEILDLDGDALPAAAVPATALRLEGEEQSAEGLTFQRSSGNLFVEGDLDRKDRFEVLSTLPALRFKQLRTARPAGAGEVASRYLDPRVRISPQVDELVRSWIANARTPYEQLVAIQSQLRGFSYTLNPPQTRSNDYVTDFLVRTQTGFCQQFATAFAVLARHLGYPSRISVGFLPGDRDPVAGVTVVRGTDAHAWPEVFFSDYGWIPFEPTPRGGAGALAPPYTSRPVPGLSQFAPDANNPFSAFIGGRAGEGLSALADQPRGEIVGPDSLDPDGRQLGAQGRRTGPEGTQAWQRTFGRLLAALSLAALVFLATMPFLKELRTRRRYAGANHPDAVAEAAFVHFQEEAAELAVARRSWESASAYADRIRELGQVVDHSAARLAHIYEAAAYAAEDITELQAQEAKRLAARLRGQLWRRASWLDRATRLFSPRRGWA